MLWIILFVFLIRRLGYNDANRIFCHATNKKNLYKILLKEIIYFIFNIFERLAAEYSSFESFLISFTINSKNFCLIASKNKYVVSNKKGTVEVDLLNATSTGEKFTKGNYADFGLADEYMVGAANSVSPYQRLKRALKD